MTRKPTLFVNNGAVAVVRSWLDDRLDQIKAGDVTRADVTKALTDKGINTSTISVQTSKWSKEHGLLLTGARATPPEQQGIRIRMYAEANYVEGHAPDVSLKSNTNLCLANGKRFGVGAVPRGSKGRKISYGPEVEGPWAYAFGLCTVIDNYPERRAEERAADVLVADGSLLRIDGVQYTVRVVRREYIELDATTN